MLLGFIWGMVMLDREIKENKIMSYVDDYDLKRKAKTLDMALCLFDIYMLPTGGHIGDCFERHNINVEDLLE